MIRSTREAKLWEDITPDMMSEEEKCDDAYIRHPPSYRSKEMDKFLTKLDKRCEEKMSSHPRIKRRLGSPRKLSVPCHAKKWVIKKNEDHDRNSESQGAGEMESITEGQSNQNEANSSGNVPEQTGDTQSLSSDFSVSSSDEDDGDREE